MKLLFILMVFSSLAFAQEVEESEALRAMRLSCVKQKVALGCFNYANMLVRNEKADEADKFYEQGCKLGHQGSCSKDKWELPERSGVSEEAVEEVVAEKIEKAPEEEARPTPPTLSNGGAAPLSSRVTVYQTSNSSGSSSEMNDPLMNTQPPQTYYKQTPKPVEPQPGAGAPLPPDMMNAGAPPWIH